MKTKLIILILFPLFLSCNTPQKKVVAIMDEITFLQSDKEILEEVLEIFANDTNTPIGVLMVKVGTFFKETPYVASTLEINPQKEQLILNLRELDCTTFAENCLAISRTIKSKNPGFEQFVSELQNIRYRNGKIDGYSSRLHYFSDWIFNNEQKKLVKNVSEEIAQIPYPLNVNFMSTHPESYVQLKDSSQIIPIIEAQEKEISARHMFYIPESKIAEMEDKMMDGDIAGITTDIKGMDIQHVVILIRKEGRIHILHASSAAEKVLVSEGTLEDYLLNSKLATGIMLARPF